MSILPQHKHTIRSLPKVHKCQNVDLPNQVHCSSVSATTTTTITKPKPNPNQLLIEPRLVLPPPTLVTTRDCPLLNDPSLQSTWAHRAWLACGCTTVLISLAKSITGAVKSHIWVEPILASLVACLLADLSSGIYHWAIDNYGSESTPIFGAQIEAFQAHHKWPWAITRCLCANLIHPQARAITLVVLPMELICDDPALLAFIGVCSGIVMFSLQFHAWAHGTKSRLPPLVVALQDVGLLVSQSHHAAHHQPPYNKRYCIVSGVWNEFLDKHKVFEALEMILLLKLGVQPRSWSESSSEWLEETEPHSPHINVLKSEG